MSAQVKIKAKCPLCEAVYKVPRQSLGHRARCVKCKAVFRVKEIPTYQARYHHPPTEDDILSWLTEDLERDDMPVRPRVISERESGSLPKARPAAEPIASPVESSLRNIKPAITEKPSASKEVAESDDNPPEDVARIRPEPASEADRPPRSPSVANRTSQEESLPPILKLRNVG